MQGATTCLSQNGYGIIKSLRLVQRTLSTGLKAAYWHTTQQTNSSITHVSSLHFLIHFTRPRAHIGRSRLRISSCCVVLMAMSIYQMPCILHVSTLASSQIVLSRTRPRLQTTLLSFSRMSTILSQIPSRFWQLCHNSYSSVCKDRATCRSL